MKTATLPSIRVEPEFRSTVESLLGDTETLSQFVENSVRETVARRRNQQDFVARGIESLEAAKAGGGYVDAEIVMDKLRARLAAAKKKKRSAAR
ncbi:MAG: prevent-host-death protein [Burkholderiaceae bacterium]|nr:prevent-host-death protein [Burkholderiaceae bacterium]